MRDKGAIVTNMRPLSDPNLGFYDVDPSNLFGNRVLNLDTRVDLDKVVIASVNVI